jgi:hypothetical protein
LPEDVPGSDLSRTEVPATDELATDELAKLRLRLDPEARKVMELHWVADHRYTQPNAETYPWMWLWDSCFHAVIYASLGDERALHEAASVFRWQGGDGMVPHMGYQRDPAYGLRAWGRYGASVITQPPMYGHALRVLDEAGFDVARLVEPATAGLRFLLRRRRLDCGLVGVVHPWETGADDSPRWNACSPAPTGTPGWRMVKSNLVDSLVLNDCGSAVANRGFLVAPASFNALVAFNARELAAVSGDRSLLNEAAELAETLDASYDGDESTWPDLAADGSVSSGVRTLDALLPVLVSDNAGHVRKAFDDLLDPAAFEARCGPCGVDRREASFSPTSYWRGSAWPQLTYLLWVAARARGEVVAEQRLLHAALEGLLGSGFAEHHHPFSGRGLGAIPHSWACLPLAMLQTTSRARATS